MVSRAVRRVPLGLLAALVPTGCFDVHSVQTGPLIIDDFEGSNGYPTDSTYHPWQCQKFLPPDAEYPCRRDEAGYKNGHALYLDAMIEDVLDTVQQKGGASVTTVPNTTVDLRRFGRLDFVAKLDRGTLPPLSKPTLEVQIGCDSAELDPQTPVPPPEGIYADYYTEPLGNDWQTVKVELGNLALVPAGTLLLERTASCLKVVDAIRLRLDAGLPDGQSGRFIFHLDDVELK